MLLKKLYQTLLTLLLLVSLCLVSRVSFANYAVPKLVMDLGLGLDWSKGESKSRLAYAGLIYEFDSSWAFTSDYIHEVADSVGALHQFGLGGKYRVDFLRLRPWFAIRAGVAFQDSPSATLGASVGLSYFLTESWQLSLWSLVNHGVPFQQDAVGEKDLTKLYYFFSLSYDFSLGEGFDEL